MKTLITLMAVILLSACGTLKSLEQLEAEAMLSGDWSAVELRERQLARRNAKRGLMCPYGQISVCQMHIGDNRCACVESDRLGAFVPR